MDENTTDIRKVQEGDTVEIVTTDGRTFEAKCESYTRRNDKDPGKVREYFNWTFSAIEWGTVYLQITEGLKSFPNEAEYPRHTQLWSDDHEESLGYVKEVTVLE